MGYKNRLVLSIFLLTILLLVVHAGVASAETPLARDTENCLLCHRYPHIGRYDEAGTKRVFYVNDKLFAESVHGRLQCKQCHIGLDKIPHTDVKKVDCSTKCHIEEPSTKQEFSHAKVIKIHEASAHGIGEWKRPNSLAKDLPTCKYCHDNRILSSEGDIWDKSGPVFNEATARCFGCHLEEPWAERFYSHVSYRMKRRRSQTEIVELCLSCHEDREMMARNGLRTMETFRETFHWVQIKFGVENAPDCLSCHAPIGHARHDILPTADPRSPVNVANRINTCRHQGGVQVCHPGAKAKFVAGREHAFGMTGPVVYASGKKMVDWAARSDFLAGQRLAALGISEGEVLRQRILHLVKLFYKLLIPSIVGFMFLHQLLDYIRTKKNHRRSR